MKVLWYATGFPPDRLVCGRETKLSSRVDDPPVSFCSALFACRFFLSYCVLLQPTLTEITQLKIGYGSLEFIFTAARFFFFFWSRFLRLVPFYKVPCRLIRNNHHLLVLVVYYCLFFVTLKIILVVKIAKSTE